MMSELGLPNPPNIDNLDEIKEKLISAFASQKEIYSSIIQAEVGMVYIL